MKPSSGRHWPDRSPEGYGGPVWTEAEENYLREHYSTTPAKEIAAALGRGHRAVMMRAHKLGLQSYRYAGCRSLVPGYFKVIDTPLKAYLLGLLTADGNVSAGGQVQLALSAKDGELVELFRDTIAPQGRIHSYLTREGNLMDVFGVRSAGLAADLARHGVVPAKSLITRWPEDVPEHLEPSFICGCFDGDGSLLPHWLYRWTLVSGSLAFLVEVQERIFRSAGIRVGGPYQDTRHEACWSICATGEPVRALDAWMHRDVPGLARKNLARCLESDRTG